MSEETPSLKPVKESSCQAKPLLPVAGFWSRLIALFIDIAALTMIIYYLGRLTFDQIYPMASALSVILPVLVWLYFALTMGPWTKGRSLGKALLNLRVAQQDGSDLSPGKACLRALLVQPLIWAYVFYLVPRFLGISLIQVPHSLLAFYGILALGYVGMGYALAVAVYTSLHPKKQAPHDLWTGTMVCRFDEEMPASRFVLERGEDQDRREKIALWPALLPPLAFMVLFGFTVRNLHSGLEDSLKARQDAMERLGDLGDLKLQALAGPMALPKNPDGTLAEDRLTTENLWVTHTFFFSFECAAGLTSPTLAAQPQWQAVRAQLPALAKDLAATHFRNPETGEVPEFDRIRLYFLRTLPLYLWAEKERLWMDEILLEEDHHHSHSGDFSPL